MAKRLSKFVTPNLDVIFSTLHKPDTEFGEDKANHNLTVVVTDELQALIDDLLSEAGVDRINGMGVDNRTGAKTLRVKTLTTCFDKEKKLIPNAAFPCVGPDARPTEMTAAGGDVVRLRLSPVINQKPRVALSLYLDGCQIVEKNAEFGRGLETAAAFEPVDDIPF